MAINSKGITIPYIFLYILTTYSKFIQIPPRYNYECKMV